MIETSGWFQNVPYWIPLLQENLRFDVLRHLFTSRDFNKISENHDVLTYDVTFLRHVTSNKMNNFEKKLFLQIVKVKGQTQGQGQINVKGQGHLKIFTILYVINVI